jgi:hypothetical protein
MRFIALCIITSLSVVLTPVVFASTTGSIDPQAFTASFLDRDTDDNGINDRINFGVYTDPTLLPYVITVSDSALSGYAWGETVGWINMNCEANGGIDCDLAGNFRVTNDGNGNLAGFAWGEQTGWVNFSCTNLGNCDENDTFGVTINPETGVFSGHAWSERFGWIVFDCNDPNRCVRTDWPVTAPTQTSSGTTSGGFLALNPRAPSVPSTIPETPSVQLPPPNTIIPSLVPPPDIFPDTTLPTNPPVTLPSQEEVLPQEEVIPSVFTTTRPVRPETPLMGSIARSSPDFWGNGIVFGAWHERLSGALAVIGSLNKFFSTHPIVGLIVELLAFGGMITGMIGLLIPRYKKTDTLLAKVLRAIFWIGCIASIIIFVLFPMLINALILILYMLMILWPHTHDS